MSLVGPARGPSLTRGTSKGNAKGGTGPYYRSRTAAAGRATRRAGPEGGARGGDGGAEIVRVARKVPGKVPSYRPRPLCRGRRAGLVLLTTRRAEPRPRQGRRQCPGLGLGSRHRS